jgi:hypothetical protein
MREQYQESIVEIESIICLCGSYDQAQATTCREYVKLMWPIYGLGILDVLSKSLKTRETIHTSTSTQVEAD